MKDLSFKKWSRDEFDEIRSSEVLPSWKTGEQVRDLQAGVEYQKTIPEEMSFAHALRKAVKEHRVLTQPRAGVALVDEHIALLKYLAEEGDADLLPTTIDSYTRQNKYEDAENGILESKRAGRSLLNGLPAVNHGLDACRKITETALRPVEVRHGSPDGRILAEITLAGGFTSYEGGGISYNIPYAKEVSLEDSIRYWQYVDFLTGLYADEGVIINREPFGPLTGTLVPPCISNAIGIIEALLAAEQGVLSITIGYGQAGNLIQDVAAINALRDQSIDYLARGGYQGISLTTVMHEWMGGFPVDEARAYSVIAWGASAAAMSGVTKVIVKTTHEALGVPTPEANANGLKATRQALNMLSCQIMKETDILDQEVSIIKEETACILEKVKELGNGDWAVGTVKAFETGVLDVPFAPSRFNRNRVLPVRDLDGCVRLFEPGGLPFTDELKTFHRDKLEQRGKAEKRAVSFQMVTDDIYAISKGNLVGKPK